MTRLVPTLLLLAALTACEGPDGNGSSLEPCKPTSVLREGDELPDCRFETLDGSSIIHLDELRGTPVVLNFWASWCLECLKEMPVLDAFDAEHPEIRVVGVDVVGLQGETIEQGRRYFDERGVSYMSLADRDGQFYGHFGPAERAIMPLTVVLDADGVVRARRFGGLNAERLETLVQDALS